MFYRTRPGSLCEAFLNVGVWLSCFKTNNTAIAVNKIVWEMHSLDKANLSGGPGLYWVLACM